MKKNFAAQPEVIDVITPLDMYTEINPNIINSEEIFKPNPLQNFQSNSPKAGYIRPSSNWKRSDGINWWQTGLDLLNTGVDAWTQTEQNKADIEQANKAAEIARLQLQIEEEQRKQQEIKSETFRKYGVPVIIATSILLVTAVTIIILKKKN
jgi:hypothetical protein